MTHPAHEEEVFPRDDFRPRPDFFANPAVERDSPKAALLGSLRAPAAPHFYVERLLSKSLKVGSKSKTTKTLRFPN